VIVLFVLVILLPLAGLLAWFVGSDSNTAPRQTTRCSFSSTDAATPLKVKPARRDDSPWSRSGRAESDPSSLRTDRRDFNPPIRNTCADLRDARGNLVCRPCRIARAR
jgi:hypothetical protein